MITYNWTKTKTAVSNQPIRYEILELHSILRRHVTVDIE